MTALALLLGFLSVLNITACGSRANSPAATPATNTSLENVVQQEKVYAANAESQLGARLLEDQFQGRSRSYWLYVPPALGNEPAPMIMLLHGTGSNGQQMLYMGDFVRHAHANNYIVVAPNALGRAFNDGSGRAGPANDKAPKDIDDVAFFAALKQRLSVEYAINPDKNYLVGFSSGGAMVQRVTLQQGDAFSAYVSVSGHLWAEGAESVKAQSLLLIFGDSDPLNPVDGGPVDYGNGLILDKPAQLATAKDWSKRFDCTTQVQARQDVVQQIGWYQCDGGGQILYQKIAGLGHFWAGGKIAHYPNLSTKRVGPYLHRFITTEVIWDYFKHVTPASDLRRPQLNIIRP